MCKEIREKFVELYSLNVNEYVEKKNGLSYLTWSYAWAEFKKMFPDATYEVKKDADGRCYFGDEHIGYMVYTSVTAGGLTYEMWLPVMDGANKAMKAEEYTYKVADWQWDNVQRKKVKVGDIEKTVEAMTMFDVNKTVMRCLVKNLAMFGLGLYIYSGEDFPEDLKGDDKQEKPNQQPHEPIICTDCKNEVAANMAERTKKAFGVVLCKDCGLKRSAQKEAKGE